MRQLFWSAEQEICPPLSPPAVAGVPRVLQRSALCVQDVRPGGVPQPALRHGTCSRASHCHMPLSLSVHLAAVLQGFFPKQSDGTCGACGSSCLACSSASQCTQCKPGFFVDTSGSCVPCTSTHSKCRACSNGSTCTSCDTGAHLYTFACPLLGPVQRMHSPLLWGSPHDC